MTLPERRHAGRPHEDAAAAAADRRREARDRTWVDGVRTGDAAAFDAIFTAYADALCGFVYTYLRSHDEAQEVVQDLFLWIWEHRAEWEVPGSLRKYLFKSARNRAISHLRHRRVERELAERLTRQAERAASEGTSPRPDDQLCADELASVIDRAVGQLSERCREVFILNRRQGFSYAEVADLLDISTKTVEIHMGRAFTTIREHIAAWRGTR